MRNPCCADIADYFEFPSLIPGAAYLLTFTAVGQPLQLKLYDGTTLLSGPYGDGASANITVPLDPDLRFGIDGAEGPGSYTVGFSTSAPEPGSMGLAATALTSALAMRRRRKS